MVWGGIQAEFVVAAPQVLDERMPSGNHSGRMEPCELTHRSEPGLEPTMICFDGVVRVLLGEVAGRAQQLIEHPRVRRRPIGAHLGGAWTVLEGTDEKLASGRQIPLLGYQDIDDLAILVDRPVQLDPAPGDVDIPLINEPPITPSVPAWPRGVDEQRGKALHPTIDSDMINTNAPLGQQLRHITVGKPEAQGPPHDHGDHLRRKPKPGEARPRDRHSSKATMYQLSLPLATIRRYNSAPREPLVAVRIGEVVAEPDEIQGDLVGDLGRVDPADRGGPVAPTPRPGQVRPGQSADR